MSSIKLSVYPPNEKLKPYVRRILVTLGDENTHETVPIGPTGFSYITYSRYPILLHYSKWDAESHAQLYLAGQIHDEQPYFTVKGKFFHIGLEALPTLPYYLFGVAGEDLVDTGMTTGQLNPEFTDEFLRNSEDEPDPQKVVEIFQEHMINYLPGIEPIDFLEDALGLIYSRHGNIEITELNQAAGLSARHFRRLFKKLVGLSPKQYCKIIQFNAVFEAIQTGNENALYGLALENGYYDHAHFINEFKAHLGKSPRDFLRSEHDFLKSYLGTFKP